MDEQEVIKNANALGVRALSEKNLQEAWEDCVKLTNRFEDLCVDTELYGLPMQDVLKDLREQTTLVVNIIKGDILRRRTNKEYITYR